MPLLVSWETPPPWTPPLTHSASGGQEESRVHTEVAPTHCLSQEQDTHLTAGPIPKDPHNNPAS